MAKDFTNGFFAVFRGIALVFSSKRLMSIAAAPILIGALALVAFAGYIIPHYVLIHHYFEAFFIEYFGLTAQNILIQIALHSLVFLLILALVFASVYILFLITKVLASPFYGLLANQVLKTRGVLKSPDLSLVKWIILSFRTTAVSLIEVLVFAIIGVILFVFSFIPVVNILAAFGFFLIMAYDSTDYSLDVLNLNLSERIRYFFTHFVQFCGFALAISLVMLIPVLNLILFAASVAGGADLVSKNLENKN
jgi:uncharacterized protein involved in cysteine biosynthesis